MFLLSLITPVVGTVGWLHLKESAVKREVKWRMIAGISREELSLVKVSKDAARSELHWEHSREFEYQGQMYDVVATETHGDTLYYWCWWDHEETRLNKQLQELVAGIMGTSPERQEKQAQLISYFQSLFCDHLFEWSASVPSYQKTPFYGHFTGFQSLLLTPPTPPPLS